MNRRADDSPKRLPRRTRAQAAPVYPFAAIVGQEEMKLALLLNAVDPKIGGVLIMGHRGTGKSTAVRALADLLPQTTRVAGCFYGCDPSDEHSLCDDCRGKQASGERLKSARAPVPVVELPLGATEDRVCGTIDIGRALREGVKAFEPGLLARANRGFLYIDEVNLLEDHLIDLLLDVAVTGISRVEREGVSVEHPARFVLVGSGNPEEGELRPQLLDRFGLHVEVRTAADLDERVLIVERREEFERGQEAFQSRLHGEQERLRRKVVRARKGLDSVLLSRDLLRRIAELCQELKTDGHRGELTVARAARALAALEGRREVRESDVRRVAVMSLRHRLRRDPLEQSSGGSRVEKRLDDLFPGEAEKREPPAGREAAAERPMSPQGPLDGGDSSDAPPTADARVPEETFTPARGKRQGAGETSRSARPQAGTGIGRFNSRRGRYSGSSPKRTDGARVALDASLRAMLSNGTRHADLNTALHYKRLKRKEGTLFIFAVDTSGSMATGRIAQAKGALVRLLQRSYVSRDRVALVTFRGEGAEQVLPPSGSVTRARNLLDRLSVGGATPLCAGLAAALELVLRARREGAGRVVLLIFTDGRANVPLGGGAGLDPAARKRLIEAELGQLGGALREAGAETVLVDTQRRFLSGGEGLRLAALIGARHVELDGGDGEVL